MPVRNPSRQADARLSLALGAAALALYVHTHDRDFGGGDVAEMQMSAECLGICHPPGYALQSLAGHVFTYLPFGALPARVNLLSAVCAAVCIALLFSSLRQLGISRLAAAPAVSALAVSDLFWRHARYAEVYAFHTMVAVGAMWCAVRFEQSRRRSAWWMECLLLGAGCSARPSFVLLLPAFAAFHWLARPRTGRAAADATQPIDSTLATEAANYRISGRNVLASAALFIAPFVGTFVYLAWRDTPTTAFNYLDSHVRLVRQAPMTPGAALPDNDTLAHRSQRALWTMSVGQFRGNVQPLGFDLENGVRYYLGRLRTVDLGWMVFALAPLGLWRWRQTPAALWLVLGIWVGDFAIYLMYAAVDRITFTLPGLCALTMLLAAGMDWIMGQVSRRHDAQWTRGCMGALAFVPSVLLALVNFAPNDGSNAARQLNCVMRSTDPLAAWEPIAMRAEAIAVLLTPPPPNARIYASFGLGRAIQCALHMGGNESNFEVIVVDDEPLRILHARANPTDRPVFFAEAALRGRAPIADDK